MKIPVVFSFDEYFALPASIAIKSLVDSKEPDTEYQVYVLHNGLSEATMKKMETIHPIRWVRVNDAIFQNVPESSLWPRTVYYRMLIPDLIPEHDRIIWSDVDVLFRKDISVLFSLPMNNAPLSAVAAERNDEQAICHPFHLESGKEFIFWSGFLVIDAAKWREERIFDRCMDVVRRQGSSFRFFDLETLNIAVEKIVRLPLECCVLETFADGRAVDRAPEYAFLSRVYSREELECAARNPAIIHYAGINPKIWCRRREEIPDYYWEYIEKSPFYRKEFYFPTVLTHLRSLVFLLAYKAMPVRKWRNALKKAHRHVLCENGYHRDRRK